jgi:hypothetical protein
LLTEVSVANYDAFVILIVAGYVVHPVDGGTLLKLLIVSDCAFITFFLQCLGISFDPALTNGRRQYEHQHEKHYDGGKVRKRSSHCESPLSRSVDICFPGGAP